MMHAHAERRWWLIPVSFLMAFLWQAMPVPIAWHQVIPNMVMMVTIYWVIRHPLRVDINSAFVIGFLYDGLIGGPLGQHALSMALTAYLTQIARPHIHLFAVWQHSAVVGMLMAAYLLINSCIHLFLTGTAYPLTAFLWPVLTSIIGWPILYALLMRLEYSYRTRKSR